MSKIDWFTRARLYVGTRLMWYGVRAMPPEMSFVEPLVEIPLGVLEEMDRGRTFGCVVIGWGDPKPATELTQAAMDAVAAKRRVLEDGLDGREHI
jgi:hypothetical protein